EDVVLAHDQESFSVDFDFGAAVFGDQHFISLFHGEIDLLAIFIHLARAESDHFSLLRFFFCRIGNNDPAFFYFLLFERLHQHPVSERSYISSCHKLSLSCLFWFEPDDPECFRGRRQIGYFFLSSSTTSNSAST